MLARAAFALALLVTRPVHARADIFDDYGDATNSFDLLLEGGAFNNRVFRGIELYDDVSLQPRLRAQANLEDVSLYIEGFSHLNTGGGEEKSFSELDYDLGGFASLGPATLHLGHRWYSYSKKVGHLDNTGEFFTKVQLDSIARPYVELDYDWDAYQGWYGEVGAEVPVPLELGTTETSIVPYAKLGFSSGLANGSRPVYSDDGFVALDVGIRGQSYLTEELYIEPVVEYTSAFDDAADSVFSVGLRLGAKGGID